ncbi:hypothetical protein [Streptomyces sp. NPDC056081]|uniref:hypothetical protein n=1 Tax=Streptomyces sp. NPDC056081 TaxID=3345705 RepID=UPI0035DDF91B
MPCHAAFPLSLWSVPVLSLLLLLVVLVLVVPSAVGSPVGRLEEPSPGRPCGTAGAGAARVTP